jgi:hypothetical protein
MAAKNRTGADTIDLNIGNKIWNNAQTHRAAGHESITLDQMLLLIKYIYI